MIDQLDYVKNKVTEIKECLIMGDEIRLGRLFDEHWKIKKQRSKFMSTSKIDSFYSDALKIGALGGKIVGAGGGGFILLVCRNNPEVTNLAKKYGYKEIGFNFEYFSAKYSFLFLYIFFSHFSSISNSSLLKKSILLKT